jgi:predicted nucleic acid-binding protein
MKDILVDASSAILLYKTGLLPTLAEYYRIIIPMTVYLELTRPTYPGAALIEQWVTKNTISICTITESATANLPALDPGERDIILAFSQGQGDFIVIDDGKAARFCRANSIPFINALLVPKIFFKAGIINATSQDQHGATLLSLGRYSKAVRHYADTCGRVELLPFMP